MNLPVHVVSQSAMDGKGEAGITFWWLGRVVLREGHREFEQSTIPGGLCATWDQIHRACEGEVRHTFGLPGMPTSHSMRFMEPSAALDGLAKKPWGDLLARLLERKRGILIQKDGLFAIVCVLLLAVVDRFQTL